MIRKNASWMRLCDERILESLREDGPSSPAVLAASKGVRGSEDEIYIRCKILGDAGLIVQSDHELFEITPRGRRYLDGEVDLGKDDRSSSQAAESEIELRATALEVRTPCLWSHCSNGRYTAV